MTSTRGRRKAKALDAPPELPGDANEQPLDGAGEDGAGDDTSGTRQFVTFSCGDETFAVDMAPVQEIIRVPTMVRVPLAPPALLGLANLRGRVLPIVSLRRVFGFDEQAHDDRSRALVIDLGQPIGFVVDRVASVVSVPADAVEGVERIQSTVSTDMLTGILKDVGGAAVSLVVDFASMISREFSSIMDGTGERTRGASGGSATHAEGDESQDATADELQLVSFNVDGQEYAVAIENVQEIVQFPGSVTVVPHADSSVHGLMTLRERVLPLLSLRALLGLPFREPDERSRVVIVALGEHHVGVVTDSVNEVLRVPLADVDPMPSFLAGDGEAGEITQLCQLAGGRRIVSVIDAARLLRLSTAVSGVTTSAGDDTDAADADADAQDDDEQVVVFRLDAEEFGVPIASVQEIVRVPDDLTRVPKAPHFVEGVINLRGEVLPVLDLRTRLGIARTERTDRQRVMVFLVAGTRTGFVVDSVAEVLRITRSAIEDAPRLSAEHGALLARMANLPKVNRMVQLLSPDHLMDDDEQAALARLAA